MNTKELAKRLKSAIELLESVLFAVDELAAFPSERMRLVEQKICLQCEKPLDGQKPIRGVHPRCRKQQKNSKTMTESQYIAKGWLLPDSPGGRPPVKLIEHKILAEKQLEELRGKPKQGKATRNDDKT